MRLATARRVMTRLRGLCGDRRGGPIVEFALAAPAVFLFLFGILQLGYAMWIKNALDSSVAAAARCASLNNSACSGQVTTYAASQSGADIGASAFTYSATASCGCQVTASYSMPLNIPWTDLSVTLTSDACVTPPPKKSCAS